MVGPLALDLNYASRGDREASVSVSSPSGNEALPFGHSGNQSISGTHSLPVCLPTLLGTPMCSSCLGFVAPMLRRPRERQLAVGRSVGRSAIERAKRRLLRRRPRLRRCIGDGGGTWPLAPPAAIEAGSGQRGPLPH